jgi:hypothetical protein
LIYETLKRAAYLGIENYYIGAGCLVQTVWNYITDNDLNFGIKDIDIVYFIEDENRITKMKIKDKATDLFKDIPINIDLVNQANVHLWYRDEFGYDIKPYSSIEEAINTWPTTATSIGARMNNDGKWIIYAPYGLNDIFNMVIRPNKVQITKEIYENKVRRWCDNWPQLNVIPWES